MISIRFVQIAAVAFGVFALFVAGRAVPIALWYPRNVYHDMLRFGFIAATMIVGLTLIFPHRSISALRELAAKIGLGPVRLLIALAMLICLLVARLSGAVALLASLPIVGAFVVAFIFPGLAFRGLTERESAVAVAEGGLSPLELGAAVGAELRTGPKVTRYVYLTFTGLIFLGALGIILGIQAIPVPFWARISTWGAVLCGGLATALFARPAFRLTPNDARRQTFPGLVVLTFALLAITIFAYRTVLHDVLPVSVAYLWGRESIQKVTVVASKPHTRRKACHGSVVVKTAAGTQEICNLSQEFLGALSTGDTVLISGRATRLGQTIDILTLVD